MTRAKRFRLFCACLITISLGGCATSAPVQHYVLVPTAADATFQAPATFVIAVGPFRVAEYLNRTHIVTRGDDVNLTFAEYDRWTEPLSKSFQRTVADNLATLLASNQVFEFPAYLEQGDAYHLAGQVTRFDTDSAGRAVLEVQWVVKDAEGDPAVTGRRSRYTGQVADPGDYTAIVTSLSELIEAFSRDAAAKLIELP